MSSSLVCVFPAGSQSCSVCGDYAPDPLIPRNCSGPRTDASPVAAEEQMPTREAPGFLDKLRNFATAAAGHVAAGMPMATDAEIIRRHDICLGCEFLQDNACTQCGCPISRVAGYVSKLSWADSECPVGKWGKSPSA